MKKFTQKTTSDQPYTIGTPKRRHNLLSTCSLLMSSPSYPLMQEVSMTPKLDAYLLSEAAAQCWAVNRMRYILRTSMH